MAAEVRGRSIFQSAWQPNPLEYDSTWKLNFFPLYFCKQNRYKQATQSPAVNSKSSNRLIFQFHRRAPSLSLSLFHFQSLFQPGCAFIFEMRNIYPQSMFFLLNYRHTLLFPAKILCRPPPLCRPPSSPSRICRHCFRRATAIGYQHDSCAINNKTEGWEGGWVWVGGVWINTRFVLRWFSAKVGVNSDQRQAGVYYQRVGVVVNRLLCWEMDSSKLDETGFSFCFSNLHLSAVGKRLRAGRVSVTTERRDGTQVWSRLQVFRFSCEKKRNSRCTVERRVCDPLVYCYVYCFLFRSLDFKDIKNLK